MGGNSKDLLLLLNVYSSDYFYPGMTRGRPRGGSGYIPRIRVNFRFEPEVAKALGKAAKRNKTSRNSYVEEAVRT